MPAKPRKNMPDPGHLLVCEKRCAQCLFTPAKIVDDARKQEILTHIDQGKANYFVCHKGSLTGNDQLVCRGWYDANPEALVVKLAQHLGVVKFVSVPQL